MENQTTTRPDAMAKVIKFLAFYGLKTNTLNIKLQGNGQLEACTGQLLTEVVSARHRKLIQREYITHLPRKDFRFQNTQLILEQSEFKIVRDDTQPTRVIA